jgi:hypothetical protein
MGKATYSTAVYKKTAPYKFSCATFLNFIFEKEGVDLATYNENYMMKTSEGVVSRVIFVDWYDQHYLTARRVLAGN